MPAVPDASDPAEPRASATVVLLRERQAGVEVCLLQRHAASAFAANAWVFPGGTVDAADQTLSRQRWDGIDPAALAERFGVEGSAVLGLHVAAVRETFEEAGILLCRRVDGRPLVVADVTAVRRGNTPFADWLARNGVVLDLGALVYWRRWVTPTLEPRRYDTAFFLARVPDGQEAVADEVEATRLWWVRPADALAEADAGRVLLVYPTLRTLAEVAAADDAEALLEAAAAQRSVRRIQPHAERDADGRVRIVHPDEPGYPHHLYGGRAAVGGPRPGERS